MISITRALGFLISVAAVMLACAGRESGRNSPRLDAAAPSDPPAKSDATAGGATASVSPDASAEASAGTSTAATIDASTGTATDAGAYAPAPAVSAVFAGEKHSCVLFVTGRIKCWGDNTSGQLGLGDTRARGDQPQTMGANLPVVNLGTGRTVVTLALGGQHTCALLDHGQMKCWGDNSYGQLGVAGKALRLGDDLAEMGDNLPALDFGPQRTVSAIAAGPSHTCAILDDGSLTCWGQDLYGCLGLGGRLQPPPPWTNGFVAIDLGTGRTATAIAAGGAAAVHSTSAGDFFWNSAFSCAVLDNGQVKCWGGTNPYGTLGADVRQRGALPNEMGDNMPAVDLGTSRAKRVVIGSAHVCALLDDNRVKCWGVEHMDQTGRGDPLVSKGLDGGSFPENDLGTGRTALSVVASGTTEFIDFAHTCVLLDNMQMKCWGSNFDGELGQGDTQGRGGVDAKGVSTMGNALLPIDLGRGRHATVIATGGNHSCALLDNAQIKCWGRSNTGELGLENTAPRGTDSDMGERLQPVTLW